MKKILKTALWSLTLLLIVMGGIAYYINEQIGEIGSFNDRKAKFSELAYYFILQRPENLSVRIS